MKCIYHPRDVSGSEQKYHVAPQAVGNRARHLWPLDELVLPKGLACDECNNYFGGKIEPGIANHPYIQQWRAVYGIGPNNKFPRYKDKNVEIINRKSGIVELRGTEIKIGRSGSFTIPQASLESVNHLQVSRAVHKVAFEYELLEIFKKEGLEAAHRAAQDLSLSQVARYVRYGHRSSYRPYGVQPQGATRVSIVPWRFEPDPSGVFISPPAFTGYIVGLPGARFSCTLAEDKSLLSYMLDRIEMMECVAFLTTRQVYWSVDSTHVVTT